MMSRRVQFLMAAALFPREAPLAKRLDVISKYLQPKPGSETVIDEATLRDRAISAKNLGRFGGSIKVSPPKGQCFTITTDRSRPDVEVCREMFVKWALDDINTETGSISWIIKTGPNDFGTPVTWTVPYVIAKVLPPEAEFFKANSTPVYFKSCVATIGDGDVKPRKVTLTKFDNSKWVVRFPVKDERMKSLNETRPGEVWGDNEKPKPDEKDKKDTTKKAAAAGEHGAEHEGSHAEAPKAEAHGEGHAEEKGEGHGDGGEHGAPPPPPPEPPKEDLEPWTIDTGRAFEMSVENFISDVSMPPGRKGTCRYVFDYEPGNFERGRIECHDTGQYRYIYAFLPCMGHLAPKELHELKEKNPAK